MSAARFPQPRLWVRALVILLAAWGLSLGPAGGQSPVSDGAVSPEPESRVFQMEYVKAVEAVRVLRDHLDSPAGPGPRPRISVDERTQSVVVTAAPADMTRIEKTLKELDKRDDERPRWRGAPSQAALKSFRLENADWDESFAAALEKYFGCNSVRIAVCGVGEGRVLLVYGPPEVEEAVGFLLQREAAWKDKAACLRPCPKPNLRSLKLSGFEFRETKWRQVFNWLSDQTELPVVTSCNPAGSFTFTPPAADTEYSVAEVIDILNNALINQGFLLFRRERGFILIPAEGEVVPAWLQRVRPADLEWHGKTELLSLEVALEEASAKEAAPEVEKLLGRRGGVVVLEKTNSLRLWGFAGNLRPACRLLEVLEEGAKKKQPLAR
jgi:hypothetical protein